MILDNDTATYQRSHLSFSINARLKQNVFNAFGKNQQKMKFIFLLACLSLALSLPRQEDAALSRELPLWLQKCKEINGDNNEWRDEKKDYCEIRLGASRVRRRRRSRRATYLCEKRFVSGECCKSCRWSVLGF